MFYKKNNLYGGFVCYRAIFDGNLMIAADQDELDAEKDYEVEDPSHPAHDFRKKCGENIRKEGIRMKKRSKSLLQPASVGNCVAVFTSGFDRGKGDPHNIIGVITDVDDHQKYTVATNVGTIDCKLERNAFEVLSYRGLQIQDVPDVRKSMREIITLQSVGNGQGYKRCLCKTKCDTARCTCRKNNLLCNSACHKTNRNCINRD